MPPDLPGDGPVNDGAAQTPDERWLEAWLTSAWRRWRLWIALRSIGGGLAVALLTRAAVVSHTPLASTVAVGLALRAQ